MSQTSDKLVALLTGQHVQGADDDRDTTFWTGIRREWEVGLYGVSADVQTDTTVPGTNLHVEAFTVNGQWQSHVRKDRYVAGAVIDKMWGDETRPWGTFSIRAKAIDGGVTSDLAVSVEGVSNEPNEYARAHADGLVRSICSHLQHA